MHVICYDCVEFRNEILLRGEECKNPKNSNFLKKGNTIILVKTPTFSKFRIMKRTSPLESSREI